MKIWVIMKKDTSPVFYKEAKPHEAFENKKAAESRVKLLNERATVNEYWVVPINFTPESTPVKRIS